MKVLTSMTLGLLAVCGTFTVGALNGVHMPAETWLLSGLGAWICSLVFAAFGLFVGFLFPAENVMQFVGPLLALMAMFGGLFIPLSQLPKGMQTFARYTPMYGVGQLARAPLVVARRRGRGKCRSLDGVVWVWCDDDVSAGYDAGVSVQRLVRRRVSARNYDRLTLPPRCRPCTQSNKPHGA